MVQRTVTKLWMVTDGEWVPANPTPEWFRQFLHGLLTKKTQELASGDVVAPRTKYVMEDETYVVQWKK